MTRAPFRCEPCGYESSRWMGFCPRCRSGGGLTQPAAAVFPVTSIPAETRARLAIGIGEVDRVLGGGLVPGSAVLVGGQPGVGKSTLLLQVAAARAARGGPVLVASAEESAAQVASRAHRLGIDDGSVLVTVESDVVSLLAAARAASPTLLVVDSIQTVHDPDSDGAPGTVSQVRGAAVRLVEYAKRTGVPVLLVGHVTKDGSLAGPKVLEHLVDAVLHLEGDPHRGVRLLRSLKNRFGSTDSVGLFEMASNGLVEVADPTAILIHGWAGDVPGSVVFPCVDGRRSLLVEIQALVTATSGPQPRRSVKGMDGARVHQILAVLERHGGFRFGKADVFVGVVGGVRVREPAADLPAALAIASSSVGRPAGRLAAWGEVGLAGEIRHVPQRDRRAAEAARAGIDRVMAPGLEPSRRIAEMLAEAGLAPTQAGSRIDLVEHLSPP